MPEQVADGLLKQSVDLVLETMFFTSPLGPAEAEAGGNVLQSRLAFQGRPSGTLGVCISTASARMLAAGFLGEDEDILTDAQTGEVVCELANMLCGSLVSKLESEESFNLASPELVTDPNLIAADSRSDSATCMSFELENGILTVTLNLESDL